MSVDIYSSKGAIFTVDEFLKAINGKNKADVVDVCHTYHEQLATQATQSPDPIHNWRSDLVESFKALCSLKKTMKLSEIRESIASVAIVGGEVSKYGECWVENSEYVESLFDRILNVCSEAENLPSISEVTAWGSARYNGWDVPLGVACVVFDSESCFTKTLSKQGKELKKLLGHCDETEWTEHSC